MTDAWKQLEGQVINGEFHLRQYLCGSDDSAVFLSVCGEELAQKVAIKLILANPQKAELQLSRWRLTANLSHPHLIRLLRTGRRKWGNTELLFIVMEYAEEDLSLVLRDRPLTPEEARDMLPPTLDALAYLYGEGFAHGHIKPANIMAIDDQLKISTDGVCPIGESIGGLSQPSVYEAPEIAREGISPAGDAWSLGMTLVETLTQRPPVWEGTQTEPVVPETLPEPFLDIARHCLRLDPRLRWSVADIAARLHQPLSVPEVRKAPRPHQAPAKWRYTVAIGTIALALAAVLGAPRLLNRRQVTGRASSGAAQEPKRQVNPKQSQKTNAKAPATEGASDRAQGPRSTAAWNPSPRNDAGAKTAPADVSQSQIVQQVLPEVPQTAKDTIQGTVRVSVKVRVDPSGREAQAELDSPGPSRYFANLALQAAQRWKFRPLKIDGQDASSEWLLRFEFSRTDTKVRPVRTSP
jgi:TonB family protein